MRRSSLGGLGALLMMTAAAQAEVVTTAWIGGSGAWESARLWSPAVVPNNTSQTSYVVKIQPLSGAPVVSIDSDPTIDSLLVGPASNLVVTDGEQLSIAKGPLIVDGLINVNGPSVAVEQIGFLDSTWIGGKGEIRLGPGVGAKLVAAQDRHLTILPDVRISGNGTVGTTSISFTNHGLIEATTSTGLVFTAKSTATSVNTGVFRAKTAQFKIETGRIDNTGGLIASEQAPLLFTGGIIVGGTIATESAAGSIKFNPGAALGVELHGTHVIGDVTLLGNGTLWIRDFVAFEGEVTLSAGADLAAANDATLLGPSVITLQSSTALVALDGATLTLPPEVQVSGTGSLVGAVRNQTVVRADVGESIHLAQAVATLRNESLIQANGGVVSAATSVDNTGGVIEAVNGGRLELDGWIKGGIIRSDGGEIRLLGGILESLTLEGDATIEDGTLGLAGTLVHHGDLISPVCQQIKLMSTYATLEGEGSWNVPAGCLGIQTDLPLALLRIGPGRTIIGNGSLGDSDLAVLNEGSIIASGLTLELDPPNALGTVNEGLLWAKSGNVLLSDGPFLNVGDVVVAFGRVLTRDGMYAQAAGRTNVNGTLTATSGSLTGGTLDGTGKVNGPLTITQGVLHPGQPVGTLTVGTLTLGAGATLEIDVWGATTGASGRVVAGQTTLGGTLRVRVSPNGPIAAGTIIPIIQASGITGSFASLETCAPISLVTAPTSISIRFDEAYGATGDLDGDGLVGVADLAVLLGAWGPATGDCEAGDLTGDALVGPSDLSLLLANWSSP